MLDFDYDPKKSKENEKRHGIDFIRAQELWDSTHVIIPAKNVAGESRYAIAGKIRGKVFMAIFTERNDVVRIISCHRADRKWERIYEEHVEEGE